ncbi:hypothetical protein BC831DRAFT_502422 [Entophlyctis helioformis]|nr:hypothetical protein BC831DRAFT_502422 [Entophlyctis helioformis]
MPCILKVRVIAARNLPIMDRTTDLTDAFVEVKFADFETFRTQICRRTLNPSWNEDFRYEVSDDADLQNEPLQIKIMDYDQITYNDAIGTIFIDLNPLLTWDSPAQIAGWFPIYDTLLGVRGEVNVQVKLHMFGDANPFKDSSAGVQFFTVSTLPPNYQIVSVLGFVSALDYQDDPEYHWSDNFRTPRKSNDARTVVMFRLSGHIRRQLGKKVLELGGNAVLGFTQYFDLESEKRAITARAIGTAVKISLCEGNNPVHAISSASLQSPPFSVQPPQRDSNVFGSPAMNPPTASTDRSDDPDEDPIEELPPPILTQQQQQQQQQQQHNHWKPTEQIPLTLDEFPRGSILGLGGLVSATSVKVLDKDERDVRQAWWSELRDEIKSHARSLRCPYIVGYTEQASINDELAVLHCTGTAAWLDLSQFDGATTNLFTGSSAAASMGMLNSSANSAFRPSYVATGLADSTTEAIPTTAVATPTTIAASVSAAAGGASEEQSTAKLAKPGTSPSAVAFSTSLEQQHQFTSRHRSILRRGSQGSHLRDNDDEPLQKKGRRKLKHLACRASHITYRRNESPFPMALTRCNLCRRKYVPEVLLTTIEPPPELESIGKGVFIEALVCRQKKTRVGDTRAVATSESIPFAQYDIHRQLMYKLRLYGLNAIFGLRIQISVGENLMTAIATGTALYVRALPTPPALQVLRNLEVVDEEDEKLMDAQRKITLQSEANRKRIEEALRSVEAAEAAAAAAAGDAEGRSNSDSDSETNSSKSDTDDEVDSPIAGSVGVAGSAVGGPAGASGSNAIGSATAGGMASGGTGSRSHQQQQQQQQRGVVVQIDDEQDEDLVLFLDQTFPEGFELCSIRRPPNLQLLLKSLYNFQMVTIVKQGRINPTTHHPNRQLAGIFRSLYQELQFQVAYFSPCIVLGIQYDVQLPKEQGVQVCLQALVVGGLKRKQEGVKAPGLTQSNSSLNLFDPAMFSSRSNDGGLGTGSGLFGTMNSAERRSGFSTLQRQATTMTTNGSMLSNMDAISVSSSVQDDSMVYNMDEEREERGSGYLSQTAAPHQPAHFGQTSVPLIQQLHHSQFHHSTAHAHAHQHQQMLLASHNTYSAGSGIQHVVNSGGSGSSDFHTGMIHTQGQSTVSFNTQAGQQGTSSTSSTHQQPPRNSTLSNSHLTQAQSALARQPTQSQLPFAYPIPIHVEISPVPFIPQSRVVRFLGRMSLHFIKEANLVYDGAAGTNGMGGFTHMFLAELYAVVKAHTVGLGGNGVIGFSMDQILFSESIKNQGYALVSVSGDVVEVEYMTPVTGSGWPAAAATLGAMGGLSTSMGGLFVSGGGSGTGGGGEGPGGFGSAMGTGARTSAVNGNEADAKSGVASSGAGLVSGFTPAAIASGAAMAAAMAAGIPVEDFIAIPQSEFATGLFERT